MSLDLLTDLLILLAKFSVVGLGKDVFLIQLVIALKYGPDDLGLLANVGKDGLLLQCLIIYL
jgi:hypothetical protein